MTSPAWRTAEVVAVAVALGLVVAVVARSLGRSEARREAAVELAAANGARLADLTRHKRESAAAVAIERAQAEARQAVANRRLSVALADTRAQLADARAFLNAERDSQRVVVQGDTLYRAAFVNDLLNIASITTQRAESLVTAVEAYQAATDSASAAHARERAALMSVLTYTDSTATAWKRAYEASQRASRPGFLRRVLGTVCEIGVTAGTATLGSAVGDVQGAAIGAGVGVLASQVACR